MDKTGLQVRRLASGGNTEGIVLCDAAGRLLPGQTRVALVTTCDQALRVVVTFEVDGSDVVLALAEDAVDGTSAAAAGE